jgi:IclR family transcriptional regulator, acetate operon repressor
MSDLTSEGTERVVGADRVLAVLVELAEHPAGISLDDLAGRIGGSKPTVHRALASLRKAGLARQTARGVYELGDEFLRLANRYQDARPETARIEPVLHYLATEFGETAHYAVLDGTDVVYRAKVDPPLGAMRLTSMVGGRNPAWCTAVGRLLMSQVIHSRSQLDDFLGDTVLSPRTPATITHRDALLAELAATRVRGYATDDQENEAGVNCIAVAAVAGAVSVSGITARCSMAELVSRVDDIRRAVNVL